MPRVQRVCNLTLKQNFILSSGTRPSLITDLDGKEGSQSTPALRTQTRLRFRGRASRPLYYPNYMSCNDVDCGKCTRRLGSCLIL